MNSTYQTKLAEIEKLICKMDLPSYRKSVKHNDDARWLKNNLHVKNKQHKNYEAAMLIINEIV
jgi:hypothetical protein